VQSSPVLEECLGVSETLAFLDGLELDMVEGRLLWIMFCVQDDSIICEIGGDPNQEDLKIACVVAVLRLVIMWKSTRICFIHV
jgi:hypothetical protein